MTVVQEIGQAPERRWTWPMVLIVVAAYPVMALLTRLLGVGAVVPFGALAGLATIAISVQRLRTGLVLTVLLALLVPRGLAFDLAGNLVTAGRILSVVFVAAWFVALSQRGSVRLHITRLDKAFVAITFSLALSFTMNSASYQGPEATEALSALLRIVVDYVAFYYAATSVMAVSPVVMDRVLRVTALCTSFVAMLGIVDWVTGRNVFELLSPVFTRGLSERVAELAQFASRERGGVRRAIGTQGGPNQLGALITMGLPLLVHYANTSRGRSRLLYTVAILVSVIGGTMTVSRSVFICLGIVIVVYVVATGQVRVSRNGITAIVVVLGLGLGANAELRATVSLYFSGLVGRNERSVQARLKDYTNVFSQFEKTPLAGSGPGSWSPQALSRPDNGKVDSTDVGQTILDNLVLATLAEGGLTGLMSLLGLEVGAIALGILAVRRARDPVERSFRSALLAALSAFLALSTFFDMFAFYSASKIYFVLLGALMVTMGAARPVEVARSARTEPMS